MHNKQDSFEILIGKQEESLSFNDIQQLKDIKFVSIAEGGAMGCSGEILMISRIDNVNVLYSGNMFYGNVIIDMEKIKSLFPQIYFMHCFFTQCNYHPYGWRYLNLGAGNNLYVSEDIYKYFDILTEKKRGADLYVSWKHYALATMTLLAKGYKNKHKFKEYYQNILMESDLKPILVSLNTKKIMAEAIKNSITSFILGDIMGTPVQFILRKNLQEALKTQPIGELILKTKSNIPFGSWSDDSSMTLCTMVSIIEKLNVDLKNIVEYFCKWLYENYMTPFDKTFDVGRTTMESLNKYMRTNKTQNAFALKGSTYIQSNGNGSLMRILPVSIYCYFKKFSKKQTFETIKDVSSITHAHPISVLGCYIYTVIVFDILGGKSKDTIIANLKNIYKDDVIPNNYREWLDEYSDILNGDIIKENSENIDSSGYVKSTLGVALWGFYNTESIEDCIFRIIELGHDSDTNGAVGASLSGLYYGLRGNFAQEYWIDKVIKKEMIFDIIDKYINTLKIEDSLHEYEF